MKSSLVLAAFLIVECSANDWPGVIEQYGLRQSVRVNAIVLEKFIVERNAIHEEFDPLHSEMLRNLPEDVLELCGISRPVISRDSYSQQYYRSARRFRPGDDFLQIGPHARS